MTLSSALPKLVALSRFRRQALVLAALLALALTAAPPALAGLGPRNDYPARLSVAGQLTITTAHDFTGECEVGQAWTITATAEVKISGRIELERIGNRIVQSTAAKTPGGAVNANSLADFRETNRCDEPVAQDPPPRCTRHAGTGAAVLQPDVDGRAPWDVGLGIARLGGGAQDLSCAGGFVTRPEPTGAQLEALQSANESIVVPLDLSVAEFARLGVRKKLKSRVTVNGPCAGAAATASSYRDDVCRVSGSFTVVVMRLPGKGRGISLARVR
ncbi:MAG: hypothetical protein U0R71_09505 [Solirubrobacterales bacterium]